MSGGPSPAHAQPFYCPYCGEQDFVPFGERPGGFYCNSCARHFEVRFVGVAAQAAEPARDHGGL
jgi:transposase-like protein